MALVSDFSHSAENTFDRLRVWQNRCWLNCFRCILLPASSVHLFFTITTGRYSFHCICRILLHLLRGSHGGPFFQDLVRVRHDNVFFLPFSPALFAPVLSHIVSDSDVYASVSVSSSRSCPLTSAGFRSCWRASWIDPSVVRSCHTLDLLSSARLTYLHCCQRSPLASAPVMICSKIWEVLLRCQHGPLMIHQRCDPLPPLFTPWRCHPHAPRRCHLRRASDSAV